MYLEIVRDTRTGTLNNFELVSKDEITKKHPFNMDLRCWTTGSRLNSRFSLSKNNKKYVYIRTDEKNKKKLELLYNSF